MNCSSLRLKTIATILFVAANAMNQANAQASAPATDTTILPATRQIPEAALLHMERGHKLIIVTSKAPTRKLTCRLDSATVDEIRCQQRSQTQPAIYRKADLDTIIEPGSSHFHWSPFLGFLTVGGGIITGACFLGAVSAIAIVGAVPVAIIGLVFVMLAPLAAVDGSETADMVLYQKPGATLAVKLR